jgi:hypothetical protein
MCAFALGRTGCAGFMLEDVRAFTYIQVLIERVDTVWSCRVRRTGQDVFLFDNDDDIRSMATTSSLGVVPVVRVSKSCADRPQTHVCIVRPLMAASVLST